MADTPEIADFAQRYRSALSAYLVGPSEAGRSEAYELGRQAVSAGVGVLDLAVIHEESTSALLGDPANSAARAPCSDFYLEALSTFDMAQRGYLEAQARARANRLHAERLARLNEAVVAVASESDLVDRLDVAIRHAGGLVDVSSSAVIFGDSVELLETEASSLMLSDLRLVAGKVRFNERSLMESVDWPETGHQRLLAVPIGSPQQVPAGAFIVWRSEPYLDDEVAILEQFARYLSMAVDIAARLEREHELAIALQNALLPPEPPTLAGMEVAWRYLPAGARDIGGDWYDVFNLDSGDVVLVIGDITGHDLTAAALMGQLRLAVQAYAVEGYGPAEVIDRANRLMQRLDSDRLATLAYLVVNSTRDRITLSNAGHPPPVVISPAGATSLLTEALSIPIGIDLNEEPRPQVEYPLLPGTRLLLYTDGLIEDRRRPLDEGFDLLMRSLRSVSARPEQICEKALTVRREPRDDVCVLCAAIEGDGNKPPRVDGLGVQSV
jgi:hypothetical protein